MTIEGISLESDIFIRKMHYKLLIWRKEPNPFFQGMLAKCQTLTQAWPEAGEVLRI